MRAWIGWWSNRQAKLGLVRGLTHREIGLDMLSSYSMRLSVDRAATSEE
jgi:hypothetical protein